MMERTLFHRVLALPFAKLPRHISWKRAVLNMVFYSLKSFPRLIAGRALAPPPPPTGSEIWDVFSQYIYLYTRCFKEKYLLQGFIIKRVAGGYADRQFSIHEKTVLSNQEIERIPLIGRRAVEQVSESVSARFEGVDEVLLRRWLQTYQYALTTTGLTDVELESALRDCLIVELGAGVGANAAVHAKMSSQGVVVFDLGVMLPVQRAVINAVASDTEISSVEFVDTVDALIAETKNKKYVVVSYWAFTEFPVSLRRSLDPLIQNSQFALFASNPVFEGADNMQYFQEACSRLQGKTLSAQPIHWQSLKGHRYVTIR